VDTADDLGRRDRSGLVPNARRYKHDFDLACNSGSAWCRSVLALVCPRHEIKHPGAGSSWACRRNVLIELIQSIQKEDGLRRDADVNRYRLVPVTVRSHQSDLMPGIERTDSCGVRFNPKLN
jgi:hypothetical protein